MADQADTSAIKKDAIQGSVWVFLLGAIAFPLTYGRTWFLGRTGTAGEVLGVYALVILLQQGIQTFLFFGGRNVLTTFFPKLRTAEQRVGLLNFYYVTVALSVAVGVLVVTLCPGAVEWLLRRELSPEARWLLIALIPVTLLASLGSSLLTAMRDFGFAALLGRLQLYGVTLLACLCFFLAPDVMAAHPFLILGGTVVAVCFLNACISLPKVHARIGFSRACRMPRNSIRFAGFAHLEKIATYFYIWADQLFVLQKFDLGTLGVYAALLQMARFVQLTVQMFGHVLLTTFSTLLGRNEESQVVSAYGKLARLSVLFHLVVCLILVLLARPIASVFGPVFAENYRYLVWLAVCINAASVTTVTSMCATAYEKMRQLLCTKLVQVGVQLVVTVALIGPLGVYGVIAGKGIGILVGTLGLFIVLASCGTGRKMRPPAVYWISQCFMVLAAVYAHAYAENWLVTAALGAAVLIGFLLAGRYRLQEFVAVVNLARKAK